MEGSAPFGVPIDPEAINRYVAEQVLASALGDALTTTIDEAIKGLGKFGNDPLKNAVISQVQSIIRELVASEYAPRIQEAVRAAMTDEMIATTVSRTVESMMSGRSF